MRRVSLVFVLLLGLVLSAGPAFASDELAKYLEGQAAAHFSGEQTVECNTPDGTISEVTFVRQAAGIRVVEDAAGAVGVTRVSHGRNWTLGDQYRVEFVGIDRFQSRSVRVVEVIEGGIARVVLFFDRASGALYASDVHNGDGSVYCSSRFQNFDAARPTMSPNLLMGLAAKPGRELEGEVESFEFPEELAGFRLNEVYRGPTADVSNGYYGDGIFSFTIFVSDRAIKVPELADAPVVEIRGGYYQRRFFPGSVIFSWETKSGGFVLVGDLPLDLQEEVLAELPAPGRPSFFVRFWRELFG